MDYDNTLHRDENGVSGINQRHIDHESDVSDNEREYHKNDESSDLKYHKNNSILLASIMCVITGFALGFILEKSKVYEPINVRGQMIFKKIIYLKVILASIASGMFGMSLIAMFPFTYSYFQRVCINFFGDLSDKGVLASAIGGSLLGIGVTLAGSCPLFVLVQFACGTPNSEFTLYGCLAGALFFAFMSSLLSRFTKPTIYTSSTNPWNESNFFITALPLVAMFGMMVIAFEILIPWSSESKIKITRTAKDINYFQSKVWQPMICGMLMGLLQVPLIICSGHVLSVWSSYITLTSLPFIGPLKRISPSMNQFRFGFKNWSKILLAVGVLVGSYYSCHLSNTYTFSKGVPKEFAFLGGFIFTFGALIAGGGPLQHASSGMSLLSILSFITVTFMFICGIITGYLMKKYDVINPSIKWRH